MSVMLLAALAMAQAAPSSTSASLTLSAEAPKLEVAYRELAADRPADAVARIETNRAMRSEPAALLNLGTAYARMGQADKAREAFRTAARSSQHYYLQLADGRWMDSREAARLAMRRLDLAHR